MVAALALWSGCDKTRAPELPPAEVYDSPVVITGGGTARSVASAASCASTSSTAALPRHVRGVTTGRQYVMNMRQVEATAGDGKLAPSNLVEFTWQDGHGDRGAGWLLVNRAGSALTGSFGHGEGVTDGAGSWTFVRKSSSDDAAERDDWLHLRRSSGDEGR